ncbi:hypothetical protein MLD38_000468 [Melastoma candidum]|uniref:Uncharacterized protein n=1 Tax=Melastoma candidum TaxID=119954 RepID=A0ACB9SA52_9MYRT|nr:hypothetical protein MLD38_000468 [Melastoma candidum]
MFDSAHLTPPQPPPPGLLDLHPNSSSGASTPPLWPTSPSADAYLTLSPASRTQAILRGQRELMELVRNLPESSYELSLKDLVDLPPPRVLLDEDKRPSIDCDRVTEGDGSGSGRRRRRRRRSGFGYGDNMGKEQRQQQEGMMLRMVFPVYTGAAAARGRKGVENRGQRKERSEEECSAGEKEWWRKRDGDSEGGGSSRKSSSSGSSRSNSANSSSTIIAVRNGNGNRNGNGDENENENENERGCWSFLRRKNSC